MTLLELILALVIVGIVLYLINRFVPMEPAIKTLLNVAVIVVLVLWLLRGLGFVGFLNRPIAP